MAFIGFLHLRHIYDTPDSISILAFALPIAFVVVVVDGGV